MDTLSRKCLFILILAVGSGCTSFPSTNPTEAVSVSVEFKDVQVRDEKGYQRIRSISGADNKRFCEDSFSAAFTRNLLKVGNESSLSVFMDKKQILLFSYDNAKRACVKENMIGDVVEGYKRKDIAGEEQHEIKIVYVDATKIGTVKHLISVAEKISGVAGQGFLAATAKAPADDIAKTVDDLISNSLSVSDKSVSTFPFPNDSARRFEIKAKIGDKTYKLAEVWLEEKKSIFESMSSQQVMTKKLMENETPNFFLEKIRNGNSRASVVGKLNFVGQECSGLQKHYEGILTEYDMKYMLESYLVSTHGSHIGPRYLNSCFGSSDEGSLVTNDLKTSMQQYWDSIGSGRGFIFMGEFYGSSQNPPANPNTKLEFAPSGFAYKNVGELLAAANQGPARCYQFSVEPRIFYFVKALDGVPYYFTGHVDRSYSEEEESKGSRSTIDRLEVAKDLWAVGSGEYASKRERCLNIYQSTYQN
ncbi:hypothetical protein [Pseudomonas sp.]|uniref:hypothetical protein n=1 Tax=Pseudomonas sp. TaxID=306 RepID=UPI003D11CDAF